MYDHSIAVMLLQGNMVQRRRLRGVQMAVFALFMVAVDCCSALSMVAVDCCSALFMVAVDCCSACSW